MILLGITSLGAAFVYPLTVKNESLWSKEKAREQTEAGCALHNLSHAHAHSQSRPPAQASAIEKRKEETQKKYDRLQSELNEARGRPHKIATVLKWLGASFTLIGAGLYYALNGRQ